MSTTEHTPLDDFSHCHEGILKHLDGFGQLPDLLDAAARARAIATDMLGFFRKSVFEHHSQEEQELFPAVLHSAQPGEEHDKVKAIANRLTREHRQVEAAWAKLEPELKKVAKGQDTRLDVEAVRELVKVYTAHARYEEQEFLPLSQTILGRNDNHMAALGLSLHLRQSVPAALARFGGGI
jgi:hemerythrin superfamily protein